VSTAESTAWPDVILGRPADASLRFGDSGESLLLPVTRWHGPVLAEEMPVLARAQSPVLDVGCGPGRHAAALRRFGQYALGIDTSRAAVRAARRRGAVAMNVSVFGAVPDPGTWATALLLDGNIGIGGDPIRLLGRIHELLAQGGNLLVEVDPPEVESRRFHARVHHGSGSGARFPWAFIGAGAIRATAAQANFATENLWSSRNRWFAELRRVEP
jgi:SAM-dependent methyltransferase